MTDPPADNLEAAEARGGKGKREKKKKMHYVCKSAGER